MYRVPIVKKHLIDLLRFFQRIILKFKKKLFDGLHLVVIQKSTKQTEKYSTEYT